MCVSKYAMSFFVYDSRQRQFTTAIVSEQRNEVKKTKIYVWNKSLHKQKKNMRNPWTLFITIWKRAKQSERERDRHTCVHTHRRHGTITALNFKFNRSLHNLIFFLCLVPWSVCFVRVCSASILWSEWSSKWITFEKAKEITLLVRLD